jgi:APA family basic amino acid/polyamine antiporter
MTASWGAVLNWRNYFRTQRIDIGDTNTLLAKVLGILDLIAYGVASTVGAGIFVITGTAARDLAGPGVVLSFLFAAFASLLSAFCYAEFAARIPVAGSAYTFSYVALGEIVGWLVGWNLTSEYAISASAVARSWAEYLVGFFKTVGVPMPVWLYEYDLPWEWSKGLFSLSPLSVLIIFLCTLLLVFGVKESATFNKIVTVFNITAILFIIVTGAFYVDRTNYKEFFPYGFNGVFKGAAKVFFAYIGFDAVSTLAGEVKKPKRDLPLGIVGTLLIATTLYCGVAIVITGMVPYSLLTDTPLADAFDRVGLHWAAIVIGVSSVLALSVTTLASLLGQPRIFFQMAQDGLLFAAFGRINKQQSPVFGTWITGLFAGVLAAVYDLDQLTGMISIGTLLAFSVVCGGVIVLRYRDSAVTASTEPSLPKHTEAQLPYARPAFRGFEGLARFCSKNISLVIVAYFLFCVGWAVLASSLQNKYDTDPENTKLWLLAPAAVPLLLTYFALQIMNHRDCPDTFQTPLVPLLPLIGVLANIYLICRLTIEAVVRVLIWSAIGIIIYMTYGIRHSKLNNTATNGFDERTPILLNANNDDKSD